MTRQFEGLLFALIAPLLDQSRHQDPHRKASEIFWTRVSQGESESEFILLGGEMLSFSGATSSGLGQNWEHQ